MVILLLLVVGGGVESLFFDLNNPLILLPAELRLRTVFERWMDLLGVGEMSSGGWFKSWERTLGPDSSNEYRLLSFIFIYEKEKKEIKEERKYNKYRNTVFTL